MPNGQELVSLSKDGMGRLTSLKSGMTKAKFEVKGRANPKLLQISPDGQLVASVWGYEVMLWYPATGQSTTYNLSLIRKVESWPLCISADCRFLACRHQRGVDILELATGRFLGETREMERASFITSGAFDSQGSMLAVGTWNGLIQIFRIVSAN